MLRRFAPALLLIFLAGVFFAPLVLHPAQVLYSDHSDMLAMHLPMKRFLVRSWQLDGNLPRWCPYSFGGMPFLSDVQVAAFYPLHAPLLLLQEENVGAAMSWIVLLHVVIAGLSMYAYSRHRGLNIVGALAAAMLFMFAGKWLLHMLAAGHYIMSPMAWLPLVLLLFERSVNRRSVVDAIYAGAVFALIVLGTHPQVTLYAGLVAAAWSFSVLRDDRRNQPLRTWVFRWLLQGAAAAGTAFILSAVQLLPAIEAASQASRGIGVPIAEVLSVFGPGLFSLFGPGSAFGWECSGGLGPLAIALLLMLPWLYPGRFRSQILCFAALLIFSLGGAALVQWLPGFRLFQIPVRMLMPAALPAAFLCGASVDYFANQRASNRALQRLPWGVFAAALLFNIPSWPNPFAVDASSPARSWTPVVLYWGVVSVSAATMSWLIRRTGGRGSFIHCALLVGCLLAESWALTWRHVAVRPIDSIYPLNPVVDRLAAAIQDSVAGGPWRVLDRCVPGDASLSPLGSALPMFGKVQVEPILGYNSFDVRRYKELLQMVIAEREPLQPRHGEFGFPISDIFPIVHKSVLDLLGTKYLTQPHRPNLLETDPKGPGSANSWRLLEVFEHPGETYSFLGGGVEKLPAYALYENTTVLPRAFMVHNWRLLDLNRTMEQMAETDFREVVLLENSAPLPQSNKLRAKDSVTFEARSPDRIALRVEAGEPGFLVLTETAYAGWTCTVDDVNVAIQRADFAFQAVPLRAGAHRVVFEFARPSLLVGQWLSCAGLIGLLFLALADVLFGRKKQTPADSLAGIAGGTGVGEII